MQGTAVHVHRGSGAGDSILKMGTWPYSMRYRLTYAVSFLNTVILPVAINWVFNRFAPPEQLL